MTLKGPTLAQKAAKKRVGGNKPRHQMLVKPRASQWDPRLRILPTLQKTRRANFLGPSSYADPGTSPENAAGATSSASTAGDRFFLLCLLAFSLAAALVVAQKNQVVPNPGGDPSSGPPARSEEPPPSTSRTDQDLDVAFHTSVSPREERECILAAARQHADQWHLTDATIPLGKMAVPSIEPDWDYQPQQPGCRQALRLNVVPLLKGRKAPSSSYTWTMTDGAHTRRPRSPSLSLG
ncbi:uncharacterized protein LOC144335219 [Macaca mulatta]